MQDEIQVDQPLIATDSRIRAALIGLAVFAVAITVGLFWAAGSFDKQDSPFGELSDGVSADVVFDLRESFAVDAEGARTPELDALLAELAADGAVAAAEYLPPAIIQGIAPDASGLEAFGHQIIIGLERSSVPGSREAFFARFEDHPGVDGIAYT